MLALDSSRKAHEWSGPDQLCNRCCITHAIISGVARSRTTWVLLAYRLPREPSTPRSALWRKLRRLGAAQLLDGLAALPMDARNREQLEWLADEVIEAGGEATIWIGELASARQERELATRMAEAVADDYAAVIAEATAAGADATGQRRRTLARLRRELRRIRARDYFPPPEREGAERAVEELATLVGELVA
jgi:Protein ChrB, N-terminal